MDKKLKSKKLYGYAYIAKRILFVKVRESVKEVVATYSIDEGSMELVVTLPSNYPLGGVTVDSTRNGSFIVFVCLVYVIFVMGL